MRTHSKEDQKHMTPRKALRFLEEGNERFVSNLKMNRNLLQQVNETAEGQYPFAVVLSCMDSRTSAELIFDQGLGDIFSVRVAGNVVNDDILGSMEYACQVVGSKLIVVLGHTRCGAIRGACDNVKMGHLTDLLSKIQPSIDKVAAGDGAVRDTAFCEEVSRQNVLFSIEEVLERSAILRKLYEDGKIGFAGGVYSVESGKVEIISERFGEKELVTEKAEEVS